MLSPEIMDRIEHIKKIIKRLFVINGLTRLFVFFCFFSIATFVIDWSIPDLPRGVRISFLLLGLGMAGYAFYRYLFYPLTKPIADDDIVICIEQSHNELNGRLISALQLNRARAESPHFNSPELVQALINETNQAVQPLDFYRIIYTTHIKRVLGLLIGLVLIIFIYATFNPLYASIWFERLLGGNAQWPKKTLFQVVVARKVIAKGQDAHVEVKIIKGSPERVYIHYEFETGEKGWERMTKLESSKFKYDFPRVHSSFRFFVRGGDNQSEWFPIQALTPPRLEQIQVWYEYPAYTKLPNTNPGQPEIGGMIRAPLGTTVTMVALANIPLSSARLTLGKSPAPQTTDLAIENDVLGEPKKVKSGLVVTGDSEYSITIKAHNDLENLEPVHYPIKVIVDTAPTIKIIEPRSDNKQITPIATIPIKLLTSDDYGINRITFLYKTVNAESPEEKRVDFTTTHNNAPYGSLKIETLYNLEITELKPKEGDIIGCWIEAEDNCAISKTNLTRTREFRFIIVNPAQLQKKIEENEMRIKEEVRKSTKLQELVKESLAEKKDIMQNEKLAPAETRNLQQDLTNQRRLTQVLERVTREFDDLINDIVINKLWDTATRDRLNAINDILKNVAGDKSPRASDSLARVLNSPNPADRLASFNEAQNLQDQIIDDLKNALTKMEEWEDYQEVVRIVRELLQKQDTIIENIKKQGK